MIYICVLASPGLPPGSARHTKIPATTDLAAWLAANGGEFTRAIFRRQSESNCNVRGKGLIAFTRVLPGGWEPVSEFYDTTLGPRPGDIVRVNDTEHRITRTVGRGSLTGDWTCVVNGKKGRWSVKSEDGGWVLVGPVSPFAPYMSRLITAP